MLSTNERVLIRDKKKIRKHLILKSIHLFIRFEFKKRANEYHCVV